MITLTHTKYCLLFSLLALISVIFLRSLLTKSKTLSTAFHFPPSPSPLPLIGHLHHLTSFLPNSLHIHSTTYGPLHRLHFGSSSMIVVSSSSIAVDFFHAHELAATVLFGDVLGPFEEIMVFAEGIDVSMKYDDLLEGMMREHEERGEKEVWEREDKDLMDILMRVYKDKEVEVKITRTMFRPFIITRIGLTNFFLVMITLVYYLNTTFIA